MTKHTDEHLHHGDNWLRRAADSIEETPALMALVLVTSGLLFAILSSLF